MSLAVISVIALITGVSAQPCPGLADASFAGLANHLLLPALSKAILKLDNLTDSILPTDPFLHSYRKTLLSIKNLAEVFAPVYPLNDSKPHDRLKTLQGFLDDGYEKVGNLQDLRLLEYSHKDLKSLRGVVMDWKKAWQSDLAEFDYMKFVSSAPEGATIPRKLSKFFWSDHTFYANADINAQANLALLLSQQLDDMAVAYQKVSQFDSVIKEDKHASFHNIRKYARGIMFVCDSFPCIVHPGNTTGTSLSLMAELYSRYGDLNDLWTNYTYEVTHDHKSKAKKAKKIVDKGWDDLLQWQTSNDLFNRMIVQLRTHIVSL